MTRAALNAWLDTSGQLLDRLSQTCAEPDCTRTAHWEAHPVGQPELLQPYCQAHATVRGTQVDAGRPVWHVQLIGL